jgi:hypothetical protein
MTSHTLVVGLVVGSVAVVFGLTPGLFDALIEGVQTFRDSILFGAPAPPRRRTEAGSLQRPLWLAAAGALFMVFTVLAYLLN